MQQQQQMDLDDLYDEVTFEAHPSDMECTFVDNHKSVDKEIRDAVKLIDDKIATLTLQIKICSHEIEKLEEQKDEYLGSSSKAESLAAINDDDDDDDDDGYNDVRSLHLERHRKYQEELNNPPMYHPAAHRNYFESGSRLPKDV